MMRTQIQLSTDQHRRLKRLSGGLGLSMSEIVRRSVDEWLGRIEGLPGRDQRLSEALAVFGKYEDAAGAVQVAEEHDRYLAATLAPGGGRRRGRRR